MTGHGKVQALFGDTEMETLPKSWQINVNQDDIDEIPEFIPISLMWLKFDIYDFIAGCKSGNQSSTANKQPFIPPANWGGKREKMREQEKNLPKDEDSWELHD